jgi:methylase of polypeptide subunit release factors
MDASPPPPPDHADADAVRLLAQALTSRGFAAERVREVVGGTGAALTPLPVVARRLAPGDPVGVLIALFLHGAPVPAAAAAQALDPLGLAAAERLGVVRVEGGEATATVRIGPFGPLLLASDRGEDLFRDFVMAGAGSSRTLASLTVRRRVRSALDLGTGSGVQAFLAARHAEKVTAVDLNPRALAFARFNALLNGIDNVEFEEGSWYAPVAGRRFDLVVSNPPFVVVPDGEFLFRDGGVGGSGDGLSRHVAEGAPEHLTDGGVAQVLLNWIHPRGQDWSAPVRAWVAGAGCDAWLLHGASDDAARYAVLWNQHLLHDPPAHAAAIERWLDAFAAAGVEAIGFGLLTLRRGNAAPWFRADELPEDPGPAAGAQLEATIAAHDALARLADLRDLLSARPVANPDHRLEQVLALRGGRYEVEAARLRLRAPLAFTADVDVFAATLLTLLDGTRTLAEAADLAAGVLDDVPADLADRAATVVASMIVMGIVQVSAEPTRPAQGR